jgi:transcriptional regulator with XRE-family HTH domain
MPIEPHPVDIHVGMRLRLRRLELKLSQKQLGEALDLSFQQVQKYEKGNNRISASKLFEIAGILEVPTLYFFEGLSTGSDEVGESASGLDGLGLTQTREGLRIVKAFSKIKDPKIRRTIIHLVEKIADSEE